MEYLEKNIPKSNQDYLYYSVCGRILRDSDPNIMSGYALEYLLSSYNKNKKVFMTNFLLGQTFVILEKYEEAYFYFKNAESLAKQKRNKERNLKEPYFELADVCIKLEKFEEALEYNKKISDQTDNEINGLRIMQLGIILSNLESESNLDKYYLLAKEISSTPFIERLYAMQKIRFTKYNEAILIYKNLVSRFPENSFFHSELATAYLLNNEFDNAQASLELSYNLNNNNKNCLRAYAVYYYFVKKDFKKAAYYANKAINVNLYKPDYMQINTEEDLFVYFDKTIFAVYKSFMNNYL